MKPLIFSIRAGHVLAAVPDDEGSSLSFFLITRFQASGEIIEQVGLHGRELTGTLAFSELFEGLKTQPLDTYDHSLTLQEADLDRLRRFYLSPVVPD